MNLALLRSTWHEASGFGDGFVGWFYGRLFFGHPELRDLFGTDMAGQRRKIADTLDLVVRGADNIEAVVPRLRKLGRMHRRFGATVDMYPAVGEALLATFARFLGDRWTPEAAATWSEAYGLVSGVMIDAHHEADRFDGPPHWDVLIVETARRRDTLHVYLDPDAQLVYGSTVEVRLPDRPGTWRTCQTGTERRPSVVVPVGDVPDGVTLDLLSAQPGDHLWIAQPIDPVDQEAHP